MIKVAMIGAGSVVFSKNLTGDILSYPPFRDATFAYMDVDPQRLEVGAKLCRKVADAIGATPRIEATVDLKHALAGADFVINMVQIGGFDSTLIDFEIPRKYGLNFTIADTTGPGGLFRALRTFPMLKELCRTMSELCPRAYLLNYANPMSMNMQTITRTSDVRAVGLCHSVQGTLGQLLSYIDLTPREVAFVCAGINHMAFYLRLEKDGLDLYPSLFQAMERPEVFGSNKVRFELMKRLGYFVTESSEHNAEYSPFFMAHGPEPIARFNVPLDEYLRRCDGIVEEFARLKTLADSDGPVEVRKSPEYGSTIIHSIATGTPAVVYGNMPNRGAIANLPANAIAEAPTLVDRAGLRFVQVGELPPQLLGYMQPHVIQQELFIRAAIEGRRDHVYQAAMFDPLTAATLTLDQIVAMCDELIAAHGDRLPNLDEKKTLVPTSGKTFAPVDPARYRAGRQDRQARLSAGIIRQWKAIGPFRSATPGSVCLDMPTPLDAKFNEIAAGRLCDGWIEACADKNGFVDLSRALGGVEWAVAFGYASVESVHARDALLTCGSDDGIQIWLNGALVHSHEIGRGFIPHNDQIRVSLNAGINHVLIKVDNYRGGWGFGVAIEPALF